MFTVLLICSGVVEKKQPADGAQEWKSSKGEDDADDADALVPIAAAADARRAVVGREERRRGADDEELEVDGGIARGKKEDGNGKMDSLLSWLYFSWECEGKVRGDEYCLISRDQTLGPAHAL